MLKLWAACQLVLQRDRMRCVLRMIPCRLSSIFYINNSMYDMLWESPSKTGVWKCLACDNLNITTNSLRSLDSYETSNPCEPLDTPNTSNISFSHIQTSSPKFKQQTPSAQQPRKKRKKHTNRSVKVLVVNCRSIADQKKEYKNIIHSTEPDVVIGTESWLKLKQFDKEIFSPDQGYTPFRSGVFIAVRNDSIVQEMKDI